MVGKKYEGKRRVTCGFIRTGLSDIQRIKKTRRQEMAKKKGKAVAVKKKAAAQVDNRQKPAETPKKPNNVVMLIVAAVVLMVIGEIYFITAKSIRQSKRPAYVTSWVHKYQGCTSIGEYGSYIYAIDNTRGTVYKTDKNTGIMENVWTYPEGVYSAVENSKGELYILTKTNEVYLVDNKTYKTLKKFNIEQQKDVIWMDVDSKDNLFFACASSGLILKYSPDFKKLLQFGGRGDEKGSLSGLAKVFAGPKDDLYVMNAFKPGAIEVKVFDNNGKFLRAWPVTNIKKFDSLTNMAIASDGNTYINAYEESKIYVFNPAGKYLGSFDGDKDKRSQIIYAASVTGGKNGVIYVHTHNLAAFKTINY
jgi:WD40 repeat protein